MDSQEGEEEERRMRKEQEADKVKKKWRVRMIDKKEENEKKGRD